MCSSVHRERASGTKLPKLDPVDASLGDEFGHAVALSGGQAVVSALEDDDLGDESGSAYLFQLDPVTGSWIELDKLNANDSVAFDLFGHAVSMSHGSRFDRCARRRRSGQRRKRGPRTSFSYRQTPTT